MLYLFKQAKLTRKSLTMMYLLLYAEDTKAYNLTSQLMFLTGMTTYYVHKIQINTLHPRRFEEKNLQDDTLHSRLKTNNYEQYNV